MTTAMLLENPSATAWAERFGNSQQASNSKDDAKEAVRLRTELLLETDPDDRLSLLVSQEWMFEEKHLREVNDLVDRFIDSAAKQELRPMANLCLTEGRDPMTIVHEWLTEKRAEALGQMVSETAVPDQLMVFCYTWLEVYEITLGIYIVEKLGRLPKPDFEHFEQTEEQHEADRRFANMA